MATWSVLSRALPADTETAAAERVVFVREKFSWAALFFAPLVLLRYRLWLVFAAYVAVGIIVGLAVALMDLPELVGEVVMAGFNVLIALELPALRVRKLAHLGYAEEGVVVAEDREEAEQRFFADWTASRPAARPQVRPAAGAAAFGEGVIGSFPGASLP